MKSKQMSFRLKNGEAEEFEAEAKAKGLTVSKYLRAILDKRGETLDTSDTSDTSDTLDTPATPDTSDKRKANILESAKLLKNVEKLRDELGEDDESFEGLDRLASGLALEFSDEPQNKETLEALKDSARLIVSDFENVQALDGLENNEEIESFKEKISGQLKSEFVKVDELVEFEEDEPEETPEDEPETPPSKKGFFKNLFSNTIFPIDFFRNPIADAVKKKIVEDDD